MILFYGEGRLGNQVFQYQALSGLVGVGSLVLAVGLEQIGNVAELLGPRVRPVVRNGLLKRCVKYGVVPLVLRPLARLRLLSHAFEPQVGRPPRRSGDGSIVVRYGLLRRVIFVDGGYYQGSALWPTLFPSPTMGVKPELREIARRFLQGAVGDGGHTPVFVHVRRGDYVTYRGYGLNSLVLPEGYFRQAMAEIERRVGSAHFIFVTDDAEWVGHQFHDVARKTVVSSTESADFAIMAACRAGVVSNSTFSLAAALLMEQPELVVAPRYWLGYSVREWLPVGMRFDHPKIVYMHVEEQPASGGAQ